MARANLARLPGTVSLSEHNICYRSFAISDLLLRARSPGSLDRGTDDSGQLGIFLDDRCEQLSPDQLTAKNHLQPIRVSLSSFKTMPNL
jgi:hypothetical protein